MMDIGTLYLSSAMSRTAILLIFLVLLLTQPKRSYLLHWIIALVSSSVGSMLGMMHVNDALLTISNAIIIYPLFFLSLTASWSGLRMFYDRRVSPTFFILLTLAPTLVYCLGVAFNFASRINLSCVYLMAALIVSLILLEIYETPNKRILSQYVVALAFFCYLSALLLPAILIAIGLMPAKQNSSSITAMLFDQAASTLVYFGYIAMNSERANIALQKMAETDPLTDLINRRGAQLMLDRLNSSFKSNNSFSILLGDIDYFKNINDTLGHKAGDIVLIGVADVLKFNLRKHDKAVRWGGEEFLIVLPETNYEDALQLAERIRMNIEENLFLYSDEVVKVTMSFGVASKTPDENSYEHMIARADQALYHAKKTGRNRVCSL